MRTMPDGRRLEALVRQLDRTLNTVEAQAIRRLDSALRASAVRLEDELRRLYTLARDAGVTESIAFREARARALLQQVRGALDVTGPAQGQLAFGELGRAAYAAGSENAARALSAYGTTTALPTLAPLAAAARATNATARLAAHGATFAQRAEAIVIDGLIRGRGFRPTATELRRETGILRYQAERLVRSESIAAADEARRDTYREAGVEHVQSMATMDDRLCGYCANRAGRVYKITDVEVPYHPNCRCYLAPWRKEWQDAGLTDDVWAAEHRRKSLERASEPQKTGPAPSERWRGVERAPTPVWSP
jgi:SPP1 gp7 family putative phage head morphogenesis protein